MKLKHFLPLFLITSFAVAATSFGRLKHTGIDEPWASAQLLAPADLAKVINDPKAKQPIIFSIGPGAIIKGSIDIGPAKEKGNLNKLRQQLSKLPKDAAIVIYCRCCPFEHCPNIRPAFILLNQMKFTDHKLLNLEHNDDGSDTTEAGDIIYQKINSFDLSAPAGREKKGTQHFSPPSKACATKKSKNHFRSEPNSEIEVLNPFSTLSLCLLC